MNTLGVPIRTKMLPCAEAVRAATGRAVDATASLLRQRLQT